MKVLTALCLILSYIHFDEASRISTTPTIDFPAQSTTQLKFDLGNGDVEPLFYTTEKVTTTSVPEQNSLENVSIQDLSLSGVDGNEKIQKKIINEIKDFPTNFRNYAKSIQLTTAAFSFPKKFIKYEMNEGFIVYRNVSSLQWYDYYEDQFRRFSIFVSCDSSSTSKIRVGLPTNIKVTANFSITHPLAETNNEGVIIIVLRNGAISKQFFGSNYENTSSKITYTDSIIDVQFEGPHKLIHNKLEVFFNEVESSLTEFFTQQLDEQLNDRQLYLPSDCSKIRFAETNVKRINLPYFNNFVNNLYVIPETKTETWNGIALSAGPIVIDGFTFNSTELSISRKYQSTHNYGSDQKQLTSRIKTGNLTGKFQWNYNLKNKSEENSSSIFYFTIDNISFENDNTYIPNFNFYNSYINVIIGKTKIKSPSSNSNLNEVKFAELVLSEYLKSTIAGSLKSSLSQRSDNAQTSFVRNLLDNL